MRLLALLTVLALAPSAAPAAQAVVPSDSTSAPSESAAGAAPGAASRPATPAAQEVRVTRAPATRAEWRRALWPWLLLAMCFVGGTALGWLGLRRRRAGAVQTTVRVRGTPQSRHLDDFDRTRTPAAPPAAPAPPAMVPRDEADALRDENERLRRQVERLSQDPPAAPPAEAPPAEARTVPATATSPSVADAVAESFAAWCRTGGGLVDKPDLFAGQIARLGATLEVVRRDQDSPARPVAFDATGGTSPAAHWLVRAGSDLLLFPQPQGPGQFRDLAPVFEGHAVPQSVQRVVPARVVSEGGGYVLTQPGHVA